MIARGFKSVVWVAAVGGAALGCYMLSLQVATERADLAKVERRIIAAKQEIRLLETELGTRGRLSQLERWNAEVLALSAPASAQYVPDAVTLARLERIEPTIEDRNATIRLASAAVEPPRAEERPDAPAAQPAAPVVRAVAPAPAPPSGPAALVQRASYAPPPKAAPASGAGPRLDAKLAEEIGAAARAEKSDKPAHRGDD